MPTIEERETLLKRTNPPRSGFTPRPVQKLATQRRPRDMLSIECNHVIRVSTEENTHSIPVLAYLMWQEAGKHRPPDNPDPAYNSNVWRNFRQQYGIPRRSKGEKINRMIAEMYPMAIPPASKVGTNTYSKFLLESDIVKNPKHYQVALQQATRDTEELHRMRLHSDLRCPPLDEDGKLYTLSVHTQMKNTRRMKCRGYIHFKWNVYTAFLCCL